MCAAHMATDECDTGRTYLCIDLKSFYASVECIERGLDPMTTNLVVADPSRTEKTICLAVSPAMKALGVPGRCRVFEIPETIDYVMAPPRMALYIERSADVYETYLHFISKDDIHVYSIDEAFFDVTDYLRYYECSARELAKRMMGAVLKRTGIPSAAGIGPNLYLCKVALDIEAKHAPENIAELDGLSFKQRLWEHRPITDFWRVGPGTERRLSRLGLRTMKEVALCDEELLYDTFGIDAELLRDHAWGVETTTIADIHAYVPESTSITSGQVLGCERSKEDARILVKEMADQLALKLVAEGSLATSLSLQVHLGRTQGSRWVGGSELVSPPSSSDRVLMAVAERIYERAVPNDARIHGLSIAAATQPQTGPVQLGLLGNVEESERDHLLQKTALAIKERFGKDSLLKAMDLSEGATTRERNHQLGGHRSGQ